MCAEKSRNFGWPVFPSDFRELGVPSENRQKSSKKYFRWNFGYRYVNWQIWQVQGSMSGMEWWLTWDMVLAWYADLGVSSKQMNVVRNIIIVMWRLKWVYLYDRLPTGKVWKSRKQTEQRVALYPGGWNGPGVMIGTWVVKSRFWVHFYAAKSWVTKRLSRFGGAGSSENATGREKNR